MDLDDWRLWLFIALALALALPSCGATHRCDVPVSVRFEPEPALPIVAIRCRDKVLWREPCPSSVVKNSRLYCGGSVAVRLPEAVTRGE